MTRKDAAGNETPAAAPATGGTISISVDSLVELGGRISVLDTKLASASGSDTAARKAFIEQALNQNAEQVDASVNGLIEQLAATELFILVGLVTRLEERIKADLSPKMDEFVTAELAKTQTAGKEEVAGLKEQRKELLNQFKALREVLQTFGQDVSSVPEPKRGSGSRTASSGGSKKASGSNKENYRYLINGKESPPSQNKFSSVAFYGTVGVPKVLDPTSTTERWSTDQLRDFIKEQDVDFPNVDSWEVKLPNDRTIGARRMTEADKIQLGLTETQTNEAVSEKVGAPTSGIVGGVQEGVTV